MIEQRVGWVGLIWLAAIPFAVAFGSLAAIHVMGVAITPADALVAIGGIVALAGSRSALSAEFPWLAGRDLPLILPLAALIALMGISLVWAPDRVLGMKEIAKWSEALIILLIVPRYIDRPRAAWAVVLACGGAAAAEALIGTLQATVLAADRGLRVTGTFGQPNPYAGYLNLALPFALAGAVWAFCGRTRPPGETPMKPRGSHAAGKRAYGVAIAIVPWTVPLGRASLGLAVGLAGALVLADSRGAWVGLWAAVVVMALVGWPALRRWFALSLAGLGAAGAAAFALMGAPLHAWLDAAGWRMLTDANLSRNVTDANFSALERLAHWVAALRMFLAHPLTGVGIGNYAVAYIAYAVPAWPRALGHAHNVYLNMAAELGGLGALLYLAFVAATLWSCWRAFRETTGAGHILALGTLGVAAAAAAHQCFDDLTTHNMLIQFALILALAQALPTIWPASPAPVEDHASRSPLAHRS